MSYFPCDIPFMSEDEKKKNGIKCNSDADKDINVPSIDTISRQATITEIKNYERDSTAPIDYVKIVEQMPHAQPEPHWIPCSERLPEKNGVYLVCYEDVTVPLDWFNGKWFFYKTNPAVEETGTLIAWMPLPEPYQEEGEQDG